VEEVAEFLLQQGAFGFGVRSAAVDAEDPWSQA
jgi:hypothetical protein